MPEGARRKRPPLISLVTTPSCKALPIAISSRCSSSGTLPLAPHEAGNEPLIVDGNGGPFDRRHPPDADVTALSDKRTHGFSEKIVHGEPASRRGAQDSQT
jgi:hypothetical protein